MDTTKEVIINGLEFFKAATKRGCIRIGMTGLTCVDIPPEHKLYKEAEKTKTENELESFFDTCIEEGLVF